MHKVFERYNSVCYKDLMLRITGWRASRCLHSCVPCKNPNHLDMQFQPFSLHASQDWGCYVILSQDAGRYCVRRLDLTVVPDPHSALYDEPVADKKGYVTQQAITI